MNPPSIPMHNKSLSLRGRRRYNYTVCLWWPITFNRNHSATLLSGAAARMQPPQLSTDWTLKLLPTRRSDEDIIRVTSWHICGGGAFYTLYYDFATQFPICGAKGQQRREATTIRRKAGRRCDSWCLCRLWIYVAFVGWWGVKIAFPWKSFSGRLVNKHPFVVTFWVYLCVLLNHISGAKRGSGAAVVFWRTNVGK